MKKLQDQIVFDLARTELRRYAACMVTEVVGAGPAVDAGKQTVQILPGDIFGKDKDETSFAMTVPATQAAVPLELETRIRSELSSLRRC